MFDTETVEGFWEFHNSNCWKISRCHMVDLYLYIPTMKYVYKTAFGEWRGTLNPTPLILQDKDEREELIEFKMESDALEWLTKLMTGE